MQTNAEWTFSRSVNVFSILMLTAVMVVPTLQADNNITATNNNSTERKYPKQVHRIEQKVPKGLRKWRDEKRSALTLVFDVFTSFEKRHNKSASKVYRDRHQKVTSFGCNKHPGPIVEEGVTTDDD
ncbi:hypothetical protein DAPPUDRAFT_95381 [Daphnia pulex]|uniref:Cathepsin propeptide inhibitor domain-containing protein n=1 Tax=Daphnia pulex TaxID=6669 RepID=E9FVK5_DAPPU|nr:hypothetical protein DAPPUDRAFT_95381 [Daphnia pulex]|eukprot:EFX88572.1 hypothetical protein DAPPUDRAFT_95381 [Daphnia pulex]